jgi:glycosyltransferase involved in cell wall biosynthesis
LEEYKEAILKVINNRNLYKNMRESVKKHYTYEKMAERIDFVFRELTKK